MGLQSASGKVSSNVDCTLKSVVEEVVADDRVEEKDNEVARWKGTGWPEIKDTFVSSVSMAYDIIFCFGSGWGGAIAGIGKFTCGPK
jgi:hypothetical protein